LTWQRALGTVGSLHTEWRLDRSINFQMRADMGWIRTYA